jgi:hypothetical protein
MDTIQAITKNIFLQSEKLSLGLSEKTSFLRRDLVIEKNIPTGWIYDLYKGSVVDAFWSVLSSPVE